jgi:hypothetical protein
VVTGSMPVGVINSSVLALLKLLTSFTPVRLFQIATRRSAGHFAARAVNSFWLANIRRGRQKGVVAVAVAPSGERMR